MINELLSKIKDIFAMSSLEKLENKPTRAVSKNKDKGDFLEIYRSYREVNFEACKHAVNPY